MRESEYRRDLVKKLQRVFPGCFIMKNDPSSLQGVPDILILYGKHWAMLEVKMDVSSDIQPNQQHYVEKFGKMSFASFINPATEEGVLYELQRAFGFSR